MPFCNPLDRGGPYPPTGRCVRHGSIPTPDREASFSDQRKNILSYLGCVKYDEAAQARLSAWLEPHARQGFRPNERFREQKRYAMMICFPIEARKVLLDRLVKMHDNYVMDLLRHCKRHHEQKHRFLPPPI